jgi:hypothetical protein
MGKKWYLSKTLIVNTIMLGSMFAAQAAGIEIPAELQGAVMIGVNFVLRLITAEPLSR